MNKYYTPEIEEFHVGFEFCDRHSNYPEEEKNWIKRDYTLRAEYELDNISGRITEGLIRVKYLDREDIESLGFVCHATDKRVFHNKEGIIINRGWGSPVKKGITLAIVSPVFDESKRNVVHENYLFNGIIKNKSELKKLLKRIGIWKKNMEHGHGFALTAKKIGMKDM